MVNLVEAVVIVLSDLDKVDSDAVGFDVGKRMHMIGAFADRWFKRFDPAAIDEALAAASAAGVVVWNDRKDMIGLV